MKKIILIVMMLVMSTLSLIASSNQSFYFIAKTTSEGVYLRWDAVEGNFPQDSTIKKIVLRREDVNLSSFTPNSVMSQGEIEVLYGKPQNQKSLKKMISSISKNDDAVCSGANIRNYASKIQACMQNSMWRYMASKVDFNIATIGHRAYLDTAVPNHVVTYELLAINEANVSKRLGKVVVNPASPTHIMGASNFKQLRQSKGCNAPEYAKDDYTVALSWENSGTKTDAFANSIMLAGYDLYRVKGSENDLNPNFKTLEGSSNVDANGEYVFAGLEKVNDVPLLLANNKGEEETLFLETKNQLKKAGLSVGDKRWYYLVAKDFTGHYGPSVKLQVVIPDLLPPEAPWGVRVIEHEKKAKLMWQKVNVANYVDYHKNSRKFCNTSTLGKGERLRYVDKDGTCGTKELEVNLNVDKYYVYRFDNPAEAAKFVDSDLDGIGDLDEKKDQVCHSTLNGNKFELPLVAILNAHDFANKEYITFTDSSVTDSKYYWYRIVAARAGVPFDTGSIMTVPVRAMIPNRTLPIKANITLKACSSAYIVASYTLDGTIDYIAYDKTGLAKRVRLTGLIVQKDGSFLDARKGIELPVEKDGLVKFPKKWGNCQFGTIEFLDEKGTLLASKTLCSNPLGLSDRDQTCKGREFYVLEENGCSYGGLEEVHAGEDLYTFPIIFFPEFIKDDECFEVTKTLMGKRYKLATICDKVKKYNTDELNISNQGKGEKICLGVNMLNANNQYSPTTYLPCFGVVDKAKPSRPDMRKIKINENNITVAWVSPQEKISSTIVSLYSKDANQSYLRTFVHPDHINQISMDTLTLSRDINMTFVNGSATKEWCAKVKSIGFNGETSAWSSVKCTQNLDDGSEVVHENLAWPRISTVTQSGNVAFSYVANGLYGTLSTLLEEGKFKRNRSKSISQQIEENLKSKALNFMFYRQFTKDVVGPPNIQGLHSSTLWSQYIQVSPLVNKIKVVRVIASYTVDNGIIAILELENNLRVKVNYSNYDKYPFATWSLFYNDSYPFETDTTYRYVKVNFDDNHEIINYAVSNEVTTTQGVQ